jgi:DNA-binding transcriptional regulator YiaG
MALDAADQYRYNSVMASSISPGLRGLEQLARVRELAASGRARELRLAARLSQTEIADACGVAPSLVSRWESGRRRPRGRAAHIYVAILDAAEREG